MSKHALAVGVPALRTGQKSVERDKAAHAGLLLQRYLHGHKLKPLPSDSESPEERLLNEVCGLRVPAAYHTAFHRWQQFAQSQPGDCARLHFYLTAAAPIAIGLGNASPLEVSITLHHTYGVPVLPGSALKGLCRRGALRLKAVGTLDEQHLQILFGSGGDASAAAGAVIFHDAWYDPNSVDGQPFHRDVITVHHPNYYRTHGKTPPTDFDDPNPVPFLVIKPGARFLFVLDAAHESWAQLAKKILVESLVHLGVGAKTNAGYGYFREGK